jgi:hypothetical protein
VGSEPWDVYSGRVNAAKGVAYFFDVKEGREGLRLVVSQTFQSGRRDRVTVAREAVGPFVRELLKAVSAMAGEAGPPSQHEPTEVNAQRKGAGNAYRPWTADEDAELLKGRAEGHGTAHLARALGRSPGAVGSRLAHLGDPGSQLPAVRRDPEAEA